MCLDISVHDRRVLPARDQENFENLAFSGTSPENAVS